MTQEEKDLLLKDLSARLPYNPIVSYFGESKILVGLRDPIAYLKESLDNDWDDDVSIDNIKPYLRPLSSMTNEENYEFKLLPSCHYEFYDWLNSHHFDWRDLIKKGIAIELPKECIEDYIKYQRLTCEYCKFYDGHDLCTNKCNFGTITEESVRKCRTNILHQIS